MSKTGPTFRIPNAIAGLRDMVRGWFGGSKGPQVHEYPTPPIHGPRIARRRVRKHFGQGNRALKRVKAAFSCGFRGWPRLISPGNAGPRLDGPKGIPYRARRAPVCPDCGNLLEPGIYSGGAPWELEVGCSFCGKMVGPIVDFVRSYPVQVREGAIYYPPGISKAHTLALLDLEARVS